MTTSVPSIFPMTETKRATKSMPAANIYRPPALRQSQAETLADNTSIKSNSRQRRPDMQMYIPRARRVAPEPSATTNDLPVEVVTPPTSSKSTRLRQSSPSVVTPRKKTHKPAAETFSLATGNRTPSCESDISNCDVEESNRVQNSSDEIVNDLPTDDKNDMNENGNIFPIKVVTDPPVEEQLISGCDQVAKNNGSIDGSPSCLLEPKNDQFRLPSPSENQFYDAMEVLGPEDVKTPTDEHAPSVNNLPDSPKTISELPTPESLQIATTKEETPVVEAEDKNVVPVLSSGVKEKKKVKKSSSIKSTSSTKSDKKSSEKSNSTTKSKKSSATVPQNLNVDECSWDVLFDDEGDCVDPSIMDELTKAVGRVRVTKPTCDYSAYEAARELVLSDAEYPHVLEIYGFSSELKTQDLMTILTPLAGTAGCDLKWVDDTHALAVFSNSQIAAEVLTYRHPLIQTRPLSMASADSKQRARKSAQFLRPYRPRPETCTALAKRMVSNALGVRLNTTKEEREREKTLLKEAREKKRLAAKQSEEAWEGKIPSK